MRSLFNLGFLFHLLNNTLGPYFITAAAADADAGAALQIPHYQIQQSAKNICKMKKGKKKYKKVPNCSECTNNQVTTIFWLYFFFFVGYLVWIP